MQSHIDATERARRLGDVAAILIDLARRHKAAESGKDDNAPAEGSVTEGGSNG